MSNIQSKIIADSLSPQGDRLTTFVVTFPRIVLAEFNTHRMFSRNSASSRAIPFEKMVKSVEENPFIPIAWQKEHKGMQGSEYITGKAEIKGIEDEWLAARDSAINHAINLNNPANTELNNVTKQLCNRLLEPFMYHTVIITSGKEGLDNFFELRCPQYTNGIVEPKKSKKDYAASYPQKGYLDWSDLDWLLINKSQAEIHIQALAEVMWDSYNESTPKELRAGEWHIPFGDKFESDRLKDLIADDLGGCDTDPEEFERIIDSKTESYKVKIATARCARVSYTVVGEEGKEPNHENDIKLHDRLLDSKHFSPFEHCAKVMDDYEYNSYVKGIIEPRDFYEDFEYVVEPLDFRDSQGWCRNYRGFIQYRELIN